MKTYRTAKIVLQDEDGMVLLLRRSASHPTQGLNFDLPGGICDDDELPTETLIRELREETGIKYNPIDLKLVFALAEEHEGKNAVRQVYAGKISGKKPTVKLSWEHTSYRWMPLRKAVKAMNPNRYKKNALKYLLDNKVLEDL